MKRNLWLLASIVLILVSGCRGKEFTIEFDLSPDIEESYRLVYYASDKSGGRWIESSAPIHQGKYAIECQTINPTVIYIFRSNGYEPETFIYAERGDKVKITGDSPRPYEWKISGNKLNDRLNEWQLANVNSLSSGQSEKINKAVASFIEKNPGSEIDPLLLLLRYDRSSDPEGFVRLWNLMNPKLRKEPTPELVASPDLFSASPLNSADDGRVSIQPGKEKFPSLKIRSFGKGKDTLKISAPGRKASVIFFWHLGDPERPAVIDSLRRLAKRNRTDSTKLLIADICLDPDSIRWRNAIPFDSLNTKRGWWPAGTADPEAIRLGISDYRTLIVFGPKGNVLYKGRDVSEAFKKIKL